MDASKDSVFLLFSISVVYSPGSVPSPICLSGSRPRAVFDGCKVSEKSPNYKIIQMGFPRFGHRKRISVTTRTYSPYILQDSATEAKTSLVMSAFFDIDLHSGRFCYTFAPARGAHKRFPFLITNPLKGGFFPALGDNSAQTALQNGPNDLSSVALLQSRSGRMGKVVGWMKKMGRVKTGGRMGMEKLRVRLFLNLSKFRTISFLGYYHLLKGSSSPCGERNAEKIRFIRNIRRRKIFFGECSEQSECRL